MHVSDLLFARLRADFARLDPAATPLPELDAFVDRCSAELRGVVDQSMPFYCVSLFHATPARDLPYRLYLAWGYRTGLHGVYPLPHYANGCTWRDLPEVDRRQLLRDLPALLAEIESECIRCHLEEALR